MLYKVRELKPGESSANGTLESSVLQYLERLVIEQVKSGCKDDSIWCIGVDLKVSLYTVMPPLKGILSNVPVPVVVYGVRIKDNKEPDPDLQV